MELPCTTRGLLNARSGQRPRDGAHPACAWPLHREHAFRPTRSCSAAPSMRDVRTRRNAHHAVHLMMTGCTQRTLRHANVPARWCPVRLASIGPLHSPRGHGGATPKTNTAPRQGMGPYGPLDCSCLSPAGRDLRSLPVLRRRSLPVKTHRCSTPAQPSQVPRRDRRFR